MQQKRPIQCQLNRPATWQKTIGFKKDATATDVQSTACTQTLHAAMLQQLVLNFQMNGIPALAATITRAFCWRRNSTLQGGGCAHTTYPG